MTQGTLEPFIAGRIELLAESLCTASTVAECLGVSRPLLSKWRAGTAMPSPAKLKLLVDLDHVMARAALIYAPDIARDWLFCHDSYLEAQGRSTFCTFRAAADFTIVRGDGPRSPSR
jgi:transcriptional regulator with XRE-family HTH domain